jgi:hypothetical protein
MADEVKPADSAQAPAGAQPVTPAATAATAPDTSQVELQRLRTELGIARKREEDTRRAYHQTQAQMKALQSRESHQETTDTGDAQGLDRQTYEETVQSAALSRVVFENAGDPTILAMIPKIDEILADPLNAQRYARSTPLATYREVVKDLRLQAAVDAAAAHAAENVELRKQLESRNSNRGTLAAQAIVSGSPASEGQETMTADDIAKMSVAEMEAKFGKVNLLRNIVR